MKAILAVLIITAAVASATEYVHLPTQARRSTEPTKVGPIHIGAWSEAVAGGWRKIEAEDYAVLSNGFERVLSEWVQHPSIPDRAMQSVVDEDRTAEVAEDAADRATMSSNLSALVQAQWGVAWTGQPAQARQLRRRLIQDSQAAQAIIADNTKTVDQRFAALSTLRRLDAISGYYKELSGK